MVNLGQISTFFPYSISLAPDSESSDSLLLCQKLLLQANTPNSFYKRRDMRCNIPTRVFKKADVVSKQV